MKNYKFSSHETLAFNKANIDINQQLHSMLLIGPMGTGKTTIANCISRNTGDCIYTMNDVNRIYRATSTFEDLVRAKTLILDDLTFSTVNHFGNVLDITQELLKERFDRMERFASNYTANIDALNLLQTTTENKDSIEFLSEEARLKMNIANFENAKQRVTIITTNMSLGEIETTMEARLFDRFQKFFKGHVYILDGISHR